MNLLKKTTLIITASIAILGSAQAGPMTRAKELAEKAHESLKENATADKGGHRVAAMKHLKAAIAEIEAGIAFDKENVTKSEGKKKNK
jgi:hypothetical protein